ncbi:MAG: Mov34/MPN/PAD-1 family protein [Candidatus Helarchaeota archaeon]|nr:Mov34/MPN/PAD-1 family protein [Candidatus Helarchaeota archaeon]
MPKKKEKKEEKGKKIDESKASEEETEGRKSEFEDPAVCVLSLESYEQIILHATRFANVKIPMDAWKEVYGFLIGTVEEDKVLVKKAVPMAHGSSVEVEFNDEHYIKSAQIDSWSAERNMFIVGWYHSHPGLGLFLSSTDITNQLGYQGPNPQAVALVFDHTKVSEPGHPGFDVFKLDNPDLGTMSDFHSIHWEIEEIDREKHVKSLYEMSERSLLKQPLAPEFGEDVSALGGTSTDIGGVEISTTPIGNIEITVPSIPIDPILEGMLSGFRRFTEEVLPPMFLASNEQSKATASAFQDLANRQVKTLNELQELLSIGVGELRKQVIAKIDDSHEGLANIMATNFSDQKEVLTKTADDVSDMEDRIIDDVVKSREEIMNQIGVKVSELTETVAENLNSMKDTLDDVQKDLVDQFKLSIEATHDELSNAIDLMKTQVLERISGIKESLKAKEDASKKTPTLAEQIKPIVAKELEKVNKKIDEMKTTQNQALEKILVKLKAVEDKLAKTE